MCHSYTGYSKCHCSQSCKEWEVLSFKSSENRSTEISLTSYWSYIHMCLINLKFLHSHVACPLKPFNMQKINYSLTFEHASPPPLYIVLQNCIILYCIPFSILTKRQNSKYFQSIFSINSFQWINWMKQFTKINFQCDWLHASMQPFSGFKMSTANCCCHFLEGLGVGWKLIGLKLYPSILVCAPIYVNPTAKWIPHHKRS